MINVLKIWWPRLSRWPLGKWLFSRMLCIMIPYTGSVFPRVQKVGSGFAEVFLKDRRCVRNHLRSVHALALANLGELTTGLAVHFAMASHKRAILTNLSINFLKKARGKITARAKIENFHQLVDGPVNVVAQLSNEQGEVVTTVVATWLLGDAQSKIAKT